MPEPYRITMGDGTVATVQDEDGVLSIYWAHYNVRLIRTDGMCVDIWDGTGDLDEPMASTFVFDSELENPPV